MPSWPEEPESDEGPLEAPQSPARLQALPDGAKTYPVTITDGSGSIDFGIMPYCVESEAVVVGHPEATVEWAEVAVGIVRFTVSGVPDGTWDMAVVIDCQ